MKYLIGYFSSKGRNGVRAFHIVAQREAMEEVIAYMNTHPSNKLVIFTRFEVTE